MRIASNKIKDVVRFFREELNGIYAKEEIETFIVFCFEEFLNLKKAEIILRDNETMSESHLLKFNFAIKDLKQHKPIQYILGKADFYGLKLKVNEHVLIPRPETEELVDLILKEFNVSSFKFNGLSSSPLKRGGEICILDIGTGSGCIPIALKKNIPVAKVYALDISEYALDVAKQNAKMNDVEIAFFQNNILSPNSETLPRNYDIIISNPPYICISEKKQMEKNVLDYEPHLALFVNDNDPFLFYKAIADYALKWLNPNGKLYFEINQAYGLETKQMLESKGFKNVELIKDLNNNNRILRGNI